MAIFGHYMSQHALAELHNHKYISGGSTSLDKLMNPWWEFVVSFMPRWLAPNLITLLGFLAANLAFVLLMIYSPNTIEELPPIPCVVAAFLYLTYQTLDAIDGKQARRTGSSSPLGTLFDHGCDIVTCTTMSLAPVITTGCGVGWLSFFSAIASCQLTQFSFLWWDYYFHVFYSNPGFGNGVTEGQVGVMAFLLACACFGNKIFGFDFLSLLPSFLRPFALQFLPSSTLTVRGLVMMYILCTNLVGVMYLFGSGLSRLKVWRERLTAFCQIASFCVFLGLEALFYNSAIFRFGVSHLLVYLTITAVYTIPAVRLLLSSTCRRSYNPVQWPTIPFAIVTLLLNFSPRVTPNIAHALVVATLIWQSLYLSDFLLTSIKDICTCLKINCFSIGQSKSDKKVE